MARIIRLTERDLTRIVRRVLSEQDENDSGIYVVKPGDNLTKIAKMYNMTVSDILKSNPQIKDANKIYPGDEINMPQQIAIKSICPKCEKLLVQKEAPNGAMYMDLEITGNIELSYNATVSPNNREVTVIKNGKPFCHIPVYDNIGDCRDKMELISDEPGSSMSASLVSPVSINISSHLPPRDMGAVIRDGNGYFCKVPKQTPFDLLNQMISENRMRQRRY